MFGDFIKHVHNNHLFSAKHRLVLAVSAGVDSVVLAHLLKMGDYQFELAHCNFKLRGKDSEADEKFCKHLAETLHVPFHSISFDVKTYSKQHKISIQIAARNLRYMWFEELLSTKNLDFVLTAHHANDSIETIFINLIRGTGINGLKGIPERNGQIIRPLLAFTKSTIEKYAKAEKIKYRLDKSNLENKYERNFIRLEVIPKLKTLNPNLEETFIHNIRRFHEETSLLNEYLLKIKESLISRSGDLISINKTELLAQSHPVTVIHFLLKPFGFNESQQNDIYQSISKNGLIGKNFYSNTHQLTIDRKDLIVRSLAGPEPTEITIHTLGEFHSKANLHVLRVKKFGLAKKNELYLNVNKLIFPVVIRNRQNGDKFKPFGMKGFKLVSDFMKDQKFNRFEKESTSIMVNGNREIIWIIGLRSDERYRIHSSDSNLIKLIREGIK